MGRKPLIRQGDVFTIPVDECSFGLGHALLVNTNCYNLYVAIYRTLHMDKALPDASYVVSDEVALIGGTMDALLHHKRWRVIGNVPVDTMRYPWPSFLVRVGGIHIVESFDGVRLREATDADLKKLDNRWSRAPIAFQNAFAALHGAGEWNENYNRLTIDHALRTSSSVN